MNELSKETLKKMVKAIAATRSEEYDCQLCLDQLEKFVEMDLNGKDASSSFPLVRQHLDSCVGCEEEYAALIDAISGMETALV